MKIKFEYKIAVIVALGAFQTTFAQKKDENIGTEVVNVVKPYTPTISDAFKVKETPVIEDDENMQKEAIEYNIFSFPVASTFTPSKGRAAGVERPKREKLFNNYATLGIGNYGTINAELFVTENISRNEYVGGMLRHLSSQGGIDGVVLDDQYYNTGIDLTYGNRQQGYTWNADLGYQNQVYNWYGLPLEYTTFTEDVIAGIDEQQKYNTLKIGGNISMKQSIFKDASLQYKRFWDAFDSAENRFVLKPSFDVSVLDEKIKLGFVVDYVGTTFAQNNNITEEQKYNYFNIGAQPSILFQRDDFSVNLGAGLFYSMGKVNDANDSKFYVYPQVKASYKVVGDLMVAYAGAEGTLKQNSYEEFVSQNPFVSPTLAMAPTDQQYDMYVGLKGKLASNVAYNVRGSYMNEADKAFFLSNSFFSPVATGLEGYQYGNSFGVIYDKLKTISFFGELKADFSKKVSAGISGTYYSYDTDQMEAWNLPELKVSANVDVDITEKWYAGANLFFVGERKDFVSVGDFDPAVQSFSDVVTLDSYFDINANVGYRYNERLTGFLKLNNIASQDYERWSSYPVQGFQFMLGASYKFNF
ncbi:TonB-dependent receptor [Flavobacterium arcticum]|uniref:TonB-dependent receptor n=1 Tax=Flavobacterium arcticum TaxID=1784713 RepID=A0A345HEC1_9FLAO|nr:TonB-dependent receptor [Flavobacterium arcticum]AXG74931.1 TonB-dependent receptor [Flavobacterium arcticum]KAF2506484.1 TonB-dependent receptor [Flavobacterium arcticum]